jgi:hypothetical protein
LSAGAAAPSTFILGLKPIICINKWIANEALIAGSENPEQLSAAEQGAEIADYLLLTMTRS